MVVDDKSLDDSTKAELLGSLDDLTEAAETPVGKRRRHRIRGAISSITAAAVAGTKLYEAWAAWGPEIERLFHG